MKNKFIKISTGFEFLDKHWGGVYPGGNYLIFGPKRSGKTLLLLKIIEHLANKQSGCLLITDERKKSLEIQASALYFDIEDFIANGFITVERLEEKTSDFESIKELVSKASVSFLFIDEITNLVNVSNTNDFNSSYINFLEYLEEKNITVFINASSLKIKDSKFIIQTIAKNSVGIIQITPGTAEQTFNGTVTLKPNIGHIEGEFSAQYKIQPIMGFVVEDKENIDLPSIINKGVDKTAVSRLMNTEGFSYSNIYNIEEFKLILESQKSYVKNTEKQINLIEYKFDKEIIDAENLSKIIKKTLSRGDKISYNSNKVFILLSEKSSNKLKRILSKLDNIIQLEFNRINNLDNVLTRTTHLLKENFTIS